MPLVRALSICSVCVAALYPVACTRDIPCEETQTCRSAAENETGASDPEDAAGADASPLACPVDQGDCDHAAFNGCEVDLTTSLLHCGGCGKRCDGWCAASSCVAGEVITTDH